MTKRVSKVEYFNLDKELHKKDVEQKEFVYPGSDPFEVLKSKEKFPSEGMIFNLKFSEGYEAVGMVVLYDQLEKAEFSENSDKYLNFSIEGKTLYFAIDNAKSSSATTKPYDRMSPSSYLPLDFEGLEQKKFESDFRLLLGKKPQGAGLSARLDNFPDQQFSRIFEKDSLDGLGQTIAATLQQKLGMNEKEAIDTAAEVTYKIYKDKETKEKES